MSKFIAGAIGAIWTVACLLVGFIGGGVVVMGMKIDNEKEKRMRPYPYTGKGGSDNE